VTLNLRLSTAFKPAFLFLLYTLYTFLAEMNAFLCHLSMYPGTTVGTTAFASDINYTFFYDFFLNLPLA